MVSPRLQVCVKGTASWLSYGFSRLGRLSGHRCEADSRIKMEIAFLKPRL